jgi:hypothetical protein
VIYTFYWRRSLAHVHTARYFPRINSGRGRGRTRAAVWARSVFLEAGSFLGHSFSARAEEVHFGTPAFVRAAPLCRARKRPRERAGERFLRNRQRGTTKNLARKDTYAPPREQEARRCCSSPDEGETFLAALTDAGTYLLPRPASCILFLVNSFNLALAESRRFFVGKFKKDVHALALLCAVAAAANLGRSRA